MLRIAAESKDARAGQRQHPQLPPQCVATFDPHRCDPAEGVGGTGFVPCWGFEGTPPEAVGSNAKLG